MNNKQLYEKIMRNISREIKYILNEGVQNFDIADYTDDDIVNNQEIDNIIGPEQKLIRKVLTGEYNSIAFTDKDIKLWNSKVAGKVIDDNGTMGCCMLSNMSSTPTYFIMRPVDVSDIISIDNSWIYTKGFKNVMVTTDNISKQTILSLIKSQTINGKIGVFAIQHKFFSDDIYYLGVIIDMDNENIIIQSEDIAESLGFDENDIQNGCITIDESLSDLINIDFVNMGIKKINHKYIDFLYAFDFEYRK